MTKYTVTHTSRLVILQPRSEDKRLNLMRLVVSGLLVAVAAVCLLTQLSAPVMSTAEEPATWTAPTITWTGPTTITLPFTQVISAITTGSYVVVVLIGQDAEGHTVTQTMWTESTIGKPESTGEFTSTAIVVLAVFGMVVVSAILVWGRRYHARDSQIKPKSIFCIQCGAENPSACQYCGKCGTKLQAT